MLLRISLSSGVDDLSSATYLPNPISSHTSSRILRWRTSIWLFLRKPPVRFVLIRSYSVSIVWRLVDHSRKVSVFLNSGDHPAPIIFFSVPLSHTYSAHRLCRLWDGYLLITLKMVV